MDKPFGELAGLLAPRSVAILGASDRAGNLGGTAVRLLKRFGFTGEIWPVNPGQETVDGLPCFAAPDQLPGVPDVAILARPADAIAQAVQECAAAGIRNGIAWAGGFAEGGGDGVARQEALVRICRDTGFRLCGPNCLGVINMESGFTGTFTSALLAMDRLIPGSISMVSQSGGTSAQAQGLAQRRGFGFRFLISCGNEAVLTAADFIRALATDDGTKVIAAYLESVVDGDGLVDALDLARRNRKPVVILKGGGSAASERAALAHTGRLAGSDRAFDAVLREVSAIRVRSLEELLDTTILISTLDQMPRGPNVAVTTFGGGAGVLSVDQCAAAGLTVPPLSAESREKMAAVVTPLASLANPIDFTPQSANDAKWLVLMPQALEMLAQDASIDLVLFLSASMSHREMEIIDAVDGLRKSTTKPVAVSWSFATPKAEAELARRGIYCFPEAARAARAIGNLVRWNAEIDAPVRPTVPRPVTIDWDKLVDPKAAMISEDKVAAILEAAKLGVAPGRLVRTADEAAAAAIAVGLPVAVKAISPALPHRAASGFLALGLAEPDMVAGAFQRFSAQAAEQGVALDGCWVQRMVTGGAELLVSAMRDPTFGVLVTVGAGGVLTELIDDMVVARAPVDTATADRLLQRLRMSRHAAAKLTPEARAAASDYVARFSQLAASAPWPRFTLELNPVKCTAGNAVAVDGLLVVEAG